MEDNDGPRRRIGGCLGRVQRSGDVMAKKIDHVQAGYRYAMNFHTPKDYKGDWSMFHAFRFLALEKIGRSPTKKRGK